MSAPDPSSPARAATACRRCGTATAHPFAGGAVCLRCAGERAFALGSGSPFDAEPPAAETEDRLAGEEADAGSDLPSRIGPYDIIEELGRGGMGRVFAARQCRLGRIVALKVLPIGPGAPVELEIRFQREAQTIARLRHPHIVAVHDSGRTAGHVYFSMDYVADGDLGRAMRTRSFTPAEAAALVAKVADALAHAHAEGVLHRDLKASNILLDGDEPRLADFGLAAQLETGSDFTGRSGLVGTPHYLAPEALRGGASRFTAASDLYALGVVLYALLTGRTPFAGASPAELASLANDTDPPPLRLLSPAVPRDLETICLKCLEREPARRYDGAAQLAADLRRFLAGDPIAAQPPGKLERFVRFARRHRTAFVVGTAFVVLLAAAAVGGTSLAVRATRAERRAAFEAGTARAISDFFQRDLLLQASPELQPDRGITLREVLDRAAQRVDGRFGQQPLVEAALRETIATTYEALGEYPAEVPQLVRALELQSALAGADAPATLRLRRALAMAKYHLGEYASAEADCSAALRRQRETLGAEHPETLESASTLALIFQAAGKLAEAERLYRQTLAARRRVLGPEQSDTLETATGLGVVLRQRGQLAEAESLLAAALAARRRLVGSEHPFTTRTAGELAGVYFAQGRAADAEVLFAEVVTQLRKQRGLEVPDTLTVMNNLAVVQQAQGKFEAAAAVFTEVVAASRRVRGPDHPNTLNARVTQAYNLSLTENFAESEAASAELLPVLLRQLGPKHAYTITALVNRAANLGTAGRFEEANVAADAALAAARAAFGPEHANVFSAMNVKASILREQGRLDEAAAQFAEVLAARQRVLGANHPSTLHSRYGLALTQQAQGRNADALVLQREVLAAREKALGISNLNTVLSLEAVGTLLNLLGKFDEAAPLLRRAWMQRRAATPAHWRTLLVQSLLGEAEAGLRRYAEAESLLLPAQVGLQERLERIPPAYRSSGRATIERLERLYVAWGKESEARRWRSALDGPAAH